MQLLCVMASVDYESEMKNALSNGHFNWQGFHAEDEAEELMANPSGTKVGNTLTGPDWLLALVHEIIHKPIVALNSDIEKLDEESVQGLRRFVFVHNGQFYGTAWTAYLERRWNAETESR